MEMETGVGTITQLGPDLSSVTMPEPTYQIVVMLGPLLSAYVVSQTRLVIGRSHRADIQVSDASISRQHLALSFGPPLTVEDLASHNGTYVGCARLPPHVAVELGRGVSISMGRASLLVRALAAVVPPGLSPVCFPPPPAPECRRFEPGQRLEMGPDAAWFRIAEGSSVDLTSHPTLRRLLFTLLFHHLRSPGERITGDELISAVWPDMRSSRECLHNRLYASLSRLRSLGLAGVILRSKGGYCLRADLTIDQRP
jgi:pSer/pThr/pTyr-binding forkhead associated (FHA) protein